MSTSGPNSVRFPVGEPATKRIIGSPVVKVVISPDAAEIFSRDRRVVMTVASDAVRKRFYPGEHEAYFKSELGEDGILELGDRVPTPAEPW